MTIPTCMICIILHLTISAASDATEVACTSSSPQQMLGRSQPTDEEDCGKEESHTTPHPLAGQ